MLIAALTGHGSTINLRDYIWFWPGVVVTVVIAFVASGWLARTWQRPRAVAFGVVFSLGLIAAATLTPSRDALLFGIPGSGTCDLSGFRPPTLSDLRSLNDTSLNVLLFVPLGVTVGIAWATRRTLPLLAASVAFPFAIEAIQSVATPLGRSCQGVDVANNLTGLVAGLAVAAMVAIGARLLGVPWWGPGDVSDAGS